MAGLHRFGRRLLGRLRPHPSLLLTPHGATADAQREFLRDEFSQAWLHFRHLEQLRGHYLAYFLALVAALTGLISATWRSIVASSPLAELVFGFALAVFVVLGSLLYFMIRKQGALLQHYREVIYAIRAHFYAGLDLTNEPYRSLDVRSSNYRVVQLRWMTVQRAAESIVLLFLSIAVTSEYIVLTYVVLATRAAPVLFAAGALLVLTTVPPVTAVWIGWEPAWRGERKRRA
jgi:hypothetical protein